MRCKGIKKEMKIITVKVENSFTNERLTHHLDMGVVWVYVLSIGLTQLATPTNIYLIHTNTTMEPIYGKGTMSIFDFIIKKGCIKVWMYSM